MQLRYNNTYLICSCELPCKSTLKNSERLISKSQAHMIFKKKQLERYSLRKNKNNNGSFTIKNNNTVGNQQKKSLKKFWREKNDSILKDNKLEALTIEKISLKESENLSNISHFQLLDNMNKKQLLYTPKWGKQSHQNYSPDQKINKTNGVEKIENIIKNKTKIINKNHQDAQMIQNFIKKIHYSQKNLQNIEISSSTKLENQNNQSKNKKTNKSQATISQNGTNKTTEQKKHEQKPSYQSSLIQYLNFTPKSCNSLVHSFYNPKRLDNMAGKKVSSVFDSNYQYEQDYSIVVAGQFLITERSQQQESPMKISERISQNWSNKTKRFNQRVG